MKEEDLTRNELMQEVAALRRRVEDLEAGLPSSGKAFSHVTLACPVEATHQREGGFELSSPPPDETLEDYRSVVESASEAICITQDGLLKFANQAGTELTGYSEQELLSMAFAALAHPDDLEELARIYMMRLRAEYVPPGHRFRIITKAGGVKWVESWSASITWQEGPAVLSMIRDVTGQVQEEERLRSAREELDCRVRERTEELQAVNERLIEEVRERQRAELSARESEDRFRRLMEHSPLGIAVASTSGIVEYVNNKFIELFGYTLKDIPTLDHWWGLAYPGLGDGERVKSEWLQATAESAEKGAEATPAEREVRCSDGRVLVIDFRKTVIDKWVIHIFHDVTERKLQEQEVLESEQMFRLLSEQSLMSIAILQDGVYKYANQAMSDLCEYSLKEILNWGPEDFLAVVHPTDRTLVMEQARMKQVGDARQQINYEFRINTKSGIVKWVEIYSKTIQYKERPANLLTMVDITERKNAEEAKRESENIYRSLVETSPDPIIVYDLEGNLLSVNRQAAMAYGVDSTKQLLSEIKSVSDILDEDSQERALSNLRQAAATGASGKSEYTVLRRDGSALPVEINTSAVRDADGEVVAFISVVRDIADRKRREEELRQSRSIISSILNSVPQSIFWKDRNSVYLGCNEVFARAVGLQSPDQIVGKTDYDLPWPRPEADAYRADDSEVMNLNRPKHHIIEPLQQADGSRLLIDTSKVPLADENGGVYGVLGVYDDITERVKAEAALRRLEDLYRNVIDNIEDVFYRSDRQGRLLMGSPSGARLFGHATVEEMIGISLESFWVNAGERDKLIAQIEKFGNVKDFEGVLKRKDGSTFVASFTTHLYTDESGEVLGTQGIIRDITAHKDAERKLRQSEERLRLAWDTSPDYFSISRLRDGLMVDVNKGFAKLTGYNREEVLRRRSHDFQLWCNPDDRQVFVSELEEHGEIRSFETRFRRKDGETRACELSAGLMDLNGEPHILAIVKDIEDTKRAQAALAKSEELFRKYFELGLVGMALTSPEKGWVYVNDRICDMLGYTRDELLQTTWTALTHPDDLGPDLAQFNRMLAGKIEGYSLDKRYVRKDGELIYTTLHVTCIRKADGTVDHVIAHLHDITEKKQSEEALRKSEQLLRQVLDTVPVRIFWKDAESVFLGCNRLFASDAGLQSPEELVGKTDFDLGWRDQAPLYREDDRQVIESARAKINYEEPQTTPDGTRIWLRTSKFPLLDPDGLIKGVLGTYEDITERKSAEEALRRSEERYRAFVANTTEGIWRFELDQPIVTSLPIEEQIEQIFQHAYLAECNDATARMYGLDRAEDLIGVRWKDMAGHDSRNIEFIRSFIRSGYRLMGAESLEMDRDGNVRCFMNSMVGLLENGHIVRAWGVQRDITEQKRAEEALREANVVVERSPVVLFRWKATDGLPVTMVSKNVVQFGYTREELLSGTVPFADMVHPQDLDRVIREVQEYSASGAVRFKQEYRIMTKVGEVRWVDDHTVVERDADGRIVFFQGTLIDITERKTFEKSLQENEKLLESILDASPVGINYVRNRQIVWSNRAWERMFGFGHPDEYVGKSTRILYQSDEEYESTAHAYYKAIKDNVTTETDVTLRRTDGSVFSGNMRVRPMQESDPEQFEAVVAVSDISNRKKAEEALKASRHRLDQIIEFLPDPTVVIDNTGRVEAWNRAMEHLTGVPAEEIIGKGDFEHALPFYLVRRPILLDLAINWDDAYLDEYASITRRDDGVLVSESYHPDLRGGIFLSGTARALYDSSGQPIGAIESLRDITEIKKTEKALRDSERRLAQIVEFLPDPTMVIDAHGKIMAWNRAMEEITGVEASSMLGKDDYEYAIPFYGVRKPVLMDLVLDFDEEVASQYRFVTREGDRLISETYRPHFLNRGPVWFWNVAAPLYDEEDKVVGAIEVVRDITERRTAEEALKLSELTYREIFNTVNDAIWIHDIETFEFLDVNDSVLEMFGYSVREALDLTVEQISSGIPPFTQETVAERLRKAAAGEPQLFEWHARHKDDHLFWTEVGLKRATIAGKECILAIERDISDRKRAEEETVRLKKYVENIINSMPSMLVGVDREGRVTQWNSSAQSMTGVQAEDARGNILSEVIPSLSNQMEKIYRAIRDRAVQLDHKVARVTESGTRYEDITVYPLASNGVEGAVIRVDDITDRVRIEEMMIQTEKMMSVGGLAAGMAHEINNPLGVIMQATQNVLRRLSPDLPANVRAADQCGLSFEALSHYLASREIVTFLEDIRASGQRAADVVANMLSFSRKSDKGGSSENLAALLDRTLELACSDYDLKKKYDFRQIEIVREYDPHAPEVICQAGKIQQVFLNILRNGAEAMNETRARGEVPRLVLRVVSEGAMVRVEIEDNGPGMEESIRKRVFEPFFTTKPPGVGTGLGMSVSYFIISDDHGGTMELESSPGYGARFVIRLPVQRRAT